MALLPAGLIVILINIVWGIIEYDPDYESEWLTPGFAVFWSIVLAIINAIVISTLSLTIFFNGIKNIRYRLFLSIISWFLAPMIWIGHYLIKALFLICSDDSYNGDITFLLLNTIPYLIGLVWSFTKFRQEMKRINIETKKI